MTFTVELTKEEISTILYYIEGGVQVSMRLKSNLKFIPSFKNWRMSND
jgi:hypothetical protein